VDMEDSPSCIIIHPLSFGVRDKFIQFVFPAKVGPRLDYLWNCRRADYGPPVAMNALYLCEPLNRLQSHFKIVAVLVHGMIWYIVVHSGSINFVPGYLTLSCVSSKVIDEELTVIFEHF